MAGTVVVTETTEGPVKRIKWAWTSDGSGDADAPSIAKYTGKVIKVVTDPGATAPTDNYDGTITDSEGIDVCEAALANRDTANTEYVADSALGVVVDSVLTLTISNAGASKVGEVFAYIR